MKRMYRILNEIDGESPGPLIILIGSLHGNETGGIKAINNVFKKIEEDRIPVNGRLIGIMGNVQAYLARKRFIDYDLNRSWTEEQIKKLKNNGKAVQFREDQEMIELIDFFDSLPPNTYTEKICVDLHTTSAENGNFIVVSESSADHPVIGALRLPLILDLEKHIRGTLLKYLEKMNILCFAFEGGLIGSEVAVRLHMAGIWEILITSGAVDKKYLEDILQMTTLLQTFSVELPDKLRVKYHYWITEGDEFKMKPGFMNFQRIKKGEVIAEDCNGEIIAPMDGLIFMPLYQRSGNDGFFIVEEIDALS